LIRPSYFFIGSVIYLSSSSSSLKAASSPSEPSGISA
jgi:hypothetical protein